MNYQPKGLQLGEEDREENSARAEIEIERYTRVRIACGQKPEKGEIDITSHKSRLYARP